jgi:asparagine synthase (glutamine-hydrolysing)
MKVRGLTGKVLLKRAARGLVPDAIIDKPKVGFFRDSVEPWLASQARGEVTDWLLGPNPRYAEFLDRDAVRRLVTAQGRGTHGNDHVVLAILMLEIWLSSFLPRATRQAAEARAAVSA